MNHPNPYESSKVEPQRGKPFGLVFLILAGLTVLCMLFVFSLFFGVSRVQSVPVAPAGPVPATQPTGGTGGELPTTSK